MRGLAVAVLLALLLASADAQTTCTGTPVGPVNSVWSPTCSGTLVGQNCTRGCKTSFWSDTPVTALCQATGAFASPTGSCYKACNSVPTTDPVTGFPIDGTWPVSCNHTQYNGLCTATCPYGKATVKCIDNTANPGQATWGQFTGTCSSVPVCASVPVLPSGQPPLNTKGFPASCLNTAVNGNCTSPCNSGYNAYPGAPTVTCKQINATFADWDYANLSPTQCDKVCGPLPVSTDNLNTTWSCGNTQIGKTCQSTCLAGFIPDPTAPAIKCVYDGTNNVWNESTLTGACRVDPAASGPVCRAAPGTTPPNTQGFPASCANQPVNATCTATCNTYYNANPTAPTVKCIQINATDGVWDTANVSPTGCAAVCPALPPSILALNATWDCPTTGPGQRCTATACTNGSVPLPSLPSLQCTRVGNVTTWNTSSLTGACAPDPGPRCGTAPPNSVTVVNAKPWPTSCIDTLAGSACVGECNTGYAGVAPSIECFVDSTSPTGGSWGITATGSCVRACAGSPPSGLLTEGGTWPASCNNAPVGTTCTASCLYGTASIKCSNNGIWDTSTFAGQCAGSPVCTTVPGVWPSNTNNFPTSCINTPVGGTCSASCRPGYNSAEPTVQCVLQEGGTSADWNLPATPTSCTRVCGALPPSVINGYNATWNCEQAQESTTCTATCAEGFVPSPNPPSLQCGPVPGDLPTWNLATLTGNCIPDPGPRCTGIPSASPVINGRPFTISCDNTPVGSACIGTCNTNYGGQPQYQVQCVADPASPTGGSFNTTAEGVCKPVCQGAPPANLLNGLGTWPATCTSNVGRGGVCSATCNNGANFGGATITCGNDLQWDVGSFTGRCSSTPACNGLPSSAVSDLGSWPSSCTSADKGTVCYGTCRSGFTADDPPRSTCVFNGTTSYWSTPVPSVCLAGTTRLPRAFLVDTNANEVVICNDNNGQLQNCESNTGAFGAVPALSGPVGIDVKGEQVWISQSGNPLLVRVCDWYSRQLTGCRQPTNLTIVGLSGAGQIALSDDQQRAYVTATNSDAIVYCNNPQLMTGCDMIDVSNSPIGLDVGLGQVWYGDMTGVTRCPVNDLLVDNSTCVNTPMGGQVNGVWLDSAARKLYLAQTALGRVMLCDVTLTLDVTNCAVTPIPKGPGAIGLDVFQGRLYVPLSTIGGEVTVCTDAAQACATSVYNLNPPRTSTGNTNIAHALPPLVPSRAEEEQV